MSRRAEAWGLRAAAQGRMITPPPRENGADCEKRGKDDMYTADQIVAHLVGDFLLQSDWIAGNKTKKTLAAAIHVVLYTLPFIFITQEPVALAIIASTHFVIDRWRLARHVAWAFNRLWPDSRPWAECRQTGFSPDLPPYLGFWLMIITDSIMHILINGLSIHYFG